MNYPILQKVTPTLLKTQAHQMMSMCYWKNRCYWSSQASSRKQSSADVVIRVADLQQVNWVGFNFCKYHEQAVGIFQELPKSEKFFYELKPNHYASFKVWCVDAMHFENLINKLNNYTDVELEFIISNPQQIPEIFQPLNLTFYERNRGC
ncbi:hypothetical protein [Anabaena azotica]|nr:hypothetical protein [Anabaena azotica]